MSLRKEFVDELVEVIQRYVRTKTTTSESYFSSTANSITYKLGYSNEDTNKVECDVFIRRLQAAEKKADNEEFLDIMVDLGATAVRIQRDTPKSTSACSDTLQYVRHRMLLVAEPPKADSSMSELKLDNEPSLYNKQFAELLAKRIKVEKEKLSDKDKEHLKANGGDCSGEVKLSPADRVANVKKIESERQSIRARIAYMGDLEPLLSQEITVTEEMFPKTRKLFGVPVGNLFEYYDSSSKKSYGAKGLLPTIPLVLQKQFCTVYLNKYPLSSPTLVTQADSEDELDSTAGSTPPDSPLASGGSTTQNIGAALGAKRVISAELRLAIERRAAQGEREENKGGQTPIVPANSTPAGKPTTTEPLPNQGPQQRATQPDQKTPVANNAGNTLVAVPTTSGNSVPVQQQTPEGVAPGAEQIENEDGVVVEEEADEADVAADQDARPTISLP